MPEVTKHEPGMFSWVDLMTTDAESAREFYKQLLGCESYDNPAGEGHIYTMLARNGKNIAGLSQMTPDMLEQGMKPCWNSYVAVADVEESAMKAAGLGGTIIVPPMDILDVGRMAITVDPTGGVLSLWEAKSHIGAQVIGEPGSFGWTELYTHDTAAAAEFYFGLFGWEAQQMEVGEGGMPYTVFMSGGAPAAGMLTIQPEWGEVPPNWTVYFIVESLEAALEKVQALGGSVQTPPTSVPTVGTFALITDPQHVHLMLMELALE